ncbi:MAG: type II glyceraldehyde-3-phosphate dehydrogenase [bacterium]|nr:type II glyceraldehyde-3-phosphate dehydrogenase [bacterium]
MTRTLARILIVGYGVVGKRVADAVDEQPDMKVEGIVGVNPSSLIAVASRTKRYPLFAKDQESLERLTASGITVTGLRDDGLEECDVVVDATRAGVAEGNISTYSSFRKPFVLNGGERAGLADISFNAQANYKEALGADSARVVSCNTTALCRILVTLQSLSSIDDVFAVAVRRAADSLRIDKGPINGIVPAAGGFSHHGRDVKSILPKIHIQTMAVKTSSTLSHVHVLRARLNSTVNTRRVIEELEKTPRILVIDTKSGLVSNAHVLEWARDKGRPRGDLWEVAVWEDSVHCSGKDLVMIYCVHNEAIVIPENIDAIRALLEMESSPGASIETTDRALDCFQDQADYSKY